MGVMVPDDSKKSFIEKQLAAKTQVAESRIDVPLFEQKIEALKKAYEQYFSGVLKREPTELRAEVAKMVRDASAVKLKTASANFKLQSLVGRYNAYCAMWNRMLLDLEEGRHQRDLFRMKLKEKTGPKESEAKEQPARAAGDPLRALYEKYVRALKDQGGDTPIPSETAFRKTIEAESRSIQEKFGANRISFSIAVTDGKVRLKARPK